MIASEPPARPTGPRLDRRALIKGGLVGAGLAGAPLAATAPGGFTHGVASGEPGPRSVLLWTRFAHDAPARLRYEMSETLDFARPVSGGDAEASPGRDWCAKAVAGDLTPATWYYYRFVAPDGTVSPTGRTRTLPEGATARFRMAVFSCSNLGFGWFNAYAHACEADEFDLAVHLGDYFYEYDSATYPSPEQRLAGRLADPLAETVALADYRLRYASYRRDPDLLRLHQLYPMIAVWDDHESANDAWRGGAENHQPETEGPWDARKAAAIRAHREWMPVSDEPFARYDIGDLASLFRLETRLTARDKPLDIGEAVRSRQPEQVEAALAAFKAGAWADPSRELLGPAQQQALSDGLAGSVRSGRKWQVLAQQVVMGSLTMPGDLAEGLAADTPAMVRRRVSAAAAAAKVGLPFNMDAWDGYPAARARLLGAAKAADANLVVLAGDSHNAWASELGAAGIEYAVQSVSSPGAEAYLPWKRPADLARDLVAANPQLAWCDTARRGYLALELTPARASGEWRFLDTVRSRSTALAGSHRMAADHGARRFTG